MTVSGGGALGHPHPDGSRHAGDSAGGDAHDHGGGPAGEHDHDADPAGGDAHDHPHGHGHDHAASSETLPEPPGPGGVVIDIGGSIGAAVVNTPVSLDGQEIEIRPEPGEWTGQHVAVRPRLLPDQTIYAAFFESLSAGSYMARVRFGPPGAVEVPFAVGGGVVTRIDWPED